MAKEFDILERKLEREQRARIEAEKLLEDKSLQLFKSNKQLMILNSELEHLVEERTQKLISTENEYHILVESINDLILKTDLSGKIVYANQIAGKILGDGKSDLLGDNIYNFIDPKKRTQIIRFLSRQFLKKNCVNYFELKLHLNVTNEKWFGVTVQFSEDKCLKCDKKLCFRMDGSNQVVASPECNYQNVIIVAHDITEQKLVQIDLKKSEKRYRELTEFLPELICEINTRGKVTYANQFALLKFGYTSDELLAESFNVFSIFSQEDRKRVQNRIEDILKSGGNYSNEYNAIKKNGESFPVLVYSSPMYSGDTVVGIRGVMVDITERKNYELEIANNLKQQEILSEISLKYNTLSDFPEKTQEALQIIGEHIKASRVYIFENSLDGLTTSNTYEWCQQGISPQITQLQNIAYAEISSFKELLLTKGIICANDITTLPDDIKVILEAQNIKSIIALPLLLEGEFLGFIGFDECNTARVWSKSEQELLRTISNLISNAFISNEINTKLAIQAQENSGIINSIPDQIIRISASGKIISIDSPNYTDGLFSKYKEGSVDYLNLLFDTDLANSFMIAIKECLALEKFKFDFSLLKRNVIEYYETRFVKLKGDVVLAIIRDVTELKENEKQLQIAKLKAEDASRVKSEFLANVSHEIRTPMNAILGFSEWLHDNVTNELHKSYLHTVLSSGRNLLVLINDILDLSRIESGKLSLHIEPMDIRRVLHDIKQILKQKIEEKNLGFDVNIDPSVPSHIFMDEVRFHQILFNIIGNAVKFTAKGYIHVSIWQTPSTVENEINLMVSIEDTGIGIKKDQQELIFTAFTQQSGQSNRHYEGTGLGLSIVSGLLKSLNADIKIKSSPGKGATFTLNFKTVKVTEIADSSNGKKTEQKKLVLNSGKILIVDDVEFNIKVLKRIIDSDTVTFLEAENGEQALDILSSEIPDIIFMDILMPGISGYAATEIIKKDDRLKHIPVVAFTASTMSTDTNKINDLFDAFLQKPALRKDVYGVLKKFLPNNFDEIEPVVEKDELFEITEICKEKIPMVLETLQNKFIPHWEKVKDDLIIFEIEEFYNQLNSFSKEKGCGFLDNYCVELNVGLQSFDIDKIRRKLAEFPEIIQKIKSYD
ncbi:hybrid sensor histidine kinase/response regulator [Labilibaculum antarcticum]|uniref:histidine kinase n=1 Tax=Labilibaculum antarcticum TaxID=1717717 RepID=A0A1Y1CJE8_9BACT|nr:PAS domain S-box protein [Labilibaculum antarcticum]BAX80454.1 hypothetical protein ALGA_2113 [Labilibaculum antarcticum]